MMLSTDDAILRVKRDLIFSAVVRKGFLALMLVIAMLGPMLHSGWISGFVLMTLLICWMALQAKSLRKSQQAAFSPMLIAAGDFQQAEEHIEQSLRGFSITQNVKVMCLHYLGMLRHAQKRFDESAMLCRAVLERQTRRINPIERPATLMLADSLLELNDLHGAHDAIARLYKHQLSLNEAMQLMVIELDYQSRIASWKTMLAGAPAKIELAEAMPTASAARAQAFLSLAAQNMGLTELSQWLRRRVELLMDRKILIEQRPLLASLWDIGP